MNRSRFNCSHPDIFLTSLGIGAFHFHNELVSIVPFTDNETGCRIIKKPSRLRRDGLRISQYSKVILLLLRHLALANYF